MPTLTTRPSVERLAVDAHRDASPAAPSRVETLPVGAAVHTSTMVDAHRVAVRVLDAIRDHDLADVSVTVEPFPRPTTATTYRVVVILTTEGLRP